jgi:uncharacterized membrane protein
MEILHRILVLVHVICGFSALSTGLLAMLTRKGGRAHRLNGKIYFILMTIVCATAMAVGMLFNQWFFFFLAFISFESAARGYRILYRKQGGEAQPPSLIDWLLVLVNLGMSAGLIGWGIRMLFAANLFGIVALVFGSLGVFVSVKYYTTFRNAAPDKSHWLRLHINGMGVSYIAAITAFLVNNDNWFPFLPSIVLWLLPTAVGVPLILRVMRNYRSRKATNTTT